MLELLILILLAFTVILAVLIASLFARMKAQEAMVRDLVLRLDAGGSPLPRHVPSSGAVPPPPPAPGPVQPAAGEPKLNILESLVGGRLLIWVGGVALVVAAIFLIRFSIEIGLVTPAMRMIAAGLFGLALVGGGEWARSSPRLAEDPRLSQALVGAGLAILYATVYGSYWLYGFFGLTIASALMLVVTVAALALALRHGPPTAIMGLVGGFLTPLLVGDPSAGAEPLLAYLALLNAAVFAIAVRRGWRWLGGLAIACSLAWTAVLLFDSPGDAMAGGWFALVLAILVGIGGRRDGHVGSGWPMAIAAGQIIALAMRSDVGAIGLVQFALAGAATLVLARLRPAARWVPSVVAAASLLIVPAKVFAFDMEPLSVIAIITTLIFGVGALGLALERRGTAMILTACIGLAGPVLMLWLMEPGRLTALQWGLFMALLGLAPLALVRREGAHPDSLIPAGTATAMLAVALSELIAWDYLSIAWLLLAIALITAGVQLAIRALRITGLALLTLTILKAFLIDAAALDGVLRILSFVGLGATLIVIGLYFGKLVRAEKAPS